MTANLYYRSSRTHAPVRINADGEMFVNDVRVELIPRPYWPLTSVGVVAGIGFARVERFRVGCSPDVIRRVEMDYRTWWDVDPASGGGNRR